MDFETLEDKEQYLASRLRSCCTPWGTEHESKLEECASILLDMGELYLEKARSSGKNIHQKLNFVKSATLIGGALVRFQRILHNKEKGEKAKQVFLRMAGELLKSCGAEVYDANLLAVSGMLMQSLSRMRQEEKKFIESKLSASEERFPASPSQECEKERIAIVRDWLKKTTHFYKDMMKTVSTKCIDILGPPPCSFSLVGLGSLAREEITLYSDFEHVILLDDTIDHVDDNEHVREYFRWYSVIFQVIVVGLGETYIPTVGISSLNDLYSEDKEKKWYFDLYTPGGVSFDGRFPHSCKVPLGKQEPSILRSHIVELIQPVNEMVNYLTDEQDLANGYHLRDVLVRTCLVDGSEDIYNEFKIKAVRLLLRETRDQEVAEQAKFVVDSVGDYMNLSLAEKPWDFKRMNIDRIKDFLYRPISLLVGCLCRVSREFSESNFDYFKWFKSNQPSINLHEVEFALAVACEVRLKIYSAVGHLRQKAWPTDIGNLVGKRRVARSYRTILVLATMFEQIGENSIGFEKFYKLLGEVAKTALGNSFIDTSILDMLGFHDDAIEERRLNGNEVAMSYFSAGLQDIHKRDEYFRIAEDLLSKSEDGETFENLKMLSLIRFHQARFQEGFDIANQWTIKHKEDKTTTANDLRYMQIQHMKSICLLKGMPPETIAEYSTKEIAESVNDPDPVTQIFFRISLFNAQMRMQRNDTAKETLREAAEICKSELAMTQLPTDLHLEATKYVLQQQTNYGWKDHAASTLELAEMLRCTQQRNTTKMLSLGVFENPVVKAESMRNGTIMQAWAKVQQCRDNPIIDCVLYGNALALTLMRRGIKNFRSISNFFTEAPNEALQEGAIFSALYFVIFSFSKQMDSDCYLVSSYDLIALLNSFPSHFENFLFLGIFKHLSDKIATKTAPLRTMDSRMTDEDLLNKLDRLFQLDIELGIASLWRMLHFEARRPHVVSFLCKCFTHMFRIAPLKTLNNLLRKKHSSFLERNSFRQPNGNARNMYNKAIVDIAYCRIFSAKSFWRIIFLAKSASKLRERCILSLMFTIIIKWEQNGYPIVVSGNYAHL